MEELQSFIEQWRWLFIIIVLLAIWDSVWKMIGMWKAARNHHLAWFICIAVINSIGILPIIYILIQRDKPAPKDYRGLQPPPPL